MNLFPSNRFSASIFSIAFLFFILCFALVPLLHQGIPDTHDGAAQVIRFGAYEKAFYDLHIPPRWAGSLNYGYGTPVLSFYYPLSGYLSTFLGVFSLSLEQRFLLLSAGSLFFGGFCWFLWSRRYQPPMQAALVSLLFALAPYQLLNLYVRGDIGELLALHCIPCVLLAVDFYAERKTVLLLLFVSLMIGLVILAHQGVALMSVPLIFLYMIVQLKKLSFWIFRIGVIGLLSFGLSAFFWIPLLYEQRYVLGSLSIGQDVTQHMLTWRHMISKAWQYGASVNEAGGQSPQVGFMAGILFVFSFVSYLFGRRNHKGLVSVFLIGIVISAVLMTNSSIFFWDAFTFLQKLQFPWRFMGLLTVSVVGCITLTLPKLPRWVAAIIFLGIIIQAYGHIHPLGYIHQTDLYYKNSPATTYFHEEATPVWTSGSASSYPQDIIEVIGGEGEVHLEQKITHRLSAQLSNISENTMLLINTLYYPGWHIFIDGQEVPIEFQHMLHRGLMIVSVPKGSRTLIAQFQETKIRMVSNSISLGVMSIMIGGTVYYTYVMVRRTLRRRKT